MTTATKLPFFTLLLLISFASVNAVLFTPALPNIAHFFAITEDTAQQTISCFLIGYAAGQLLYGPIANHFGRKPALYAGISLQILSSFLCILAGYLHQYPLLVFARFLLALGSGVGLKMTFTLVNEAYEPKIASQKIAYLTLAFAITPGLSVALGGFLNNHYGWASCFYAEAIYGLILLFLVTKIVEPNTALDCQAFSISHLLNDYALQFKNRHLIAGGLLMGFSTSFVYIFAAIAPFVAINMLGMNSAQYGSANILPSIGLIAGSLTSASLTKEYSFKTLIALGISAALFGIILMGIAAWLHLPALFSLFLPMIVIYFGLSLILNNASAIAMSSTVDKAHGAAVMSFVNMGVPTVIVLNLGLFSVNTALLPMIYLGLGLAMIVTYLTSLSA